jgi:hypothetical protein
VQLEGLSQLKNSLTSSKPLPSGLKHSGSTNCATACPLQIENIRGLNLAAVKLTAVQVTNLPL